MDDLISRKALWDALKFREGVYGTHSYDGFHYGVTAEVVANAPSVPAVPLDKLCLLLHDIAGCPCHTQPGEDMCNRLIGDYCNPEWDDIECWKQFLTKWMEGLDAAG